MLLTVSQRWVLLITSKAASRRRNRKNNMQFKDIESFADIEIGDLVRIQRGPLECSTQIVSKIIRTIGTFCPIMGWYGGPSVKFSFVDGGSAYHFQLDQEQPIQEKHWLK